METRGTNNPAAGGAAHVAAPAVSDRWAIGAAYEAYMGRWSRLLAKPFVEWLGVEPRAHWLDVGCGTGALTQAICDLGRPGTVVGCDSSGPFLEAASSTLPDKRVSFELGKGEHVPDREGGFDAIVSGLVLNFLPDARRALTAMRRRLSPRGQVAAYVWDYAGGVEFLSHFWAAAVALDAGAAALDEGQRFLEHGEAGLRAAFAAAGLGEIEVERLKIVTSFASFEDYWQPFLGRTGPAPSYVASLDAAHRARLEALLLQRLQPNTEGRIVLQASAWAVRGRPLGV
jgi:SAM-dependent methyltransferase